MKKAFLQLLIFSFFVFGVQSSAQDRNKNKITSHPMPIGSEGVQWYTTWDTAKAEAVRSGRPIFFMAAAHECSGVAGVF